MMKMLNDESVRYFSGLDSEKRFAYCRAIRAGDRIHVSGSTALVSSGGVAAGQVDNAYAQSAEALARIETALAYFGAALSDVVLVRTYLTDVKHVPGYLKAHAESFASAPPAATMVGTPFLADAALVVEIEVEAVV